MLPTRLLPDWHHLSQPSQLPHPANDLAHWQQQEILQSPAVARLEVASDLAVGALPGVQARLLVPDEPRSSAVCAI